MGGGKRNANGTGEDEEIGRNAEAAARKGGAETPSAESHPPPRPLHPLPPHLYKSGGNSGGGVSGTDPVKIR